MPVVTGSLSISSGFSAGFSADGCCGVEFLLSDGVAVYWRRRGGEDAEKRVVLGGGVWAFFGAGVDGEADGAVFSVDSGVVGGCWCN